MNAMTNTSAITNILVVGIGGQGVLTASEILAQCAMELGFDVKKTEVAGMAQRGGVVSSHLRFGDKVLSPMIQKGTADILVGFEPAESMRWCNHLRSGGVAMVNTARVAPPVVNAGLFPYPDDPIAAIKAAGHRVFAFDAGSLAEEMGDLRLINTILLGAIADYLPFAPAILKESIVARFRSRKPEMAAVNEQAFEAGRAAISAKKEEGLVSFSAA